MMRAEDILLDDLIEEVNRDFARAGYLMFWTKRMPEDEEDALSIREEGFAEDEGYLVTMNPRQHSREGFPLFLAFPIANIMRCARRLDGDLREGFILAVKKEGKATNAVLVCSKMGISSFQLGLFGKKFEYIEDELVPEWENVHKKRWRMD